MKRPLLARTLTIATVAILVLLPIRMIDDKISERRARAESVASQFAAETSGPQLVAGPFLALTCEETTTVQRTEIHAGKAETVHDRKVGRCTTEFFTPKTFQATGSMPVDTLHRGLYTIRRFRAPIELSGEFAFPGAPPSDATASRRWKHAYLVTYVRDSRGIKAIASNISTDLVTNTEDGTLQGFPVREAIAGDPAALEGTRLPFRYTMTLAGTASLAVAAVGDRSDVRLSSDWPHPSFGTDWSPDERRIDAKGVDATWHVSSVASGGQAAWRRIIEQGKLQSAPAAGFSLYDPVNIYTLSYRATEYAFLFVLFTFAALALAEVTAGIRLHPVQYALVGSAIAVFFLLLIALSEHIAFGTAYLAAAAACVALLGFYLRHPLGTTARAAVFTSLFAGLYAMLYALLLSEDNALLMGSAATFALLAFAMIATRKVDWPALSLAIAAKA